jgi:hypothetical protein
MASNLYCICKDRFGCEKHSFTLASARVMNHVHSVTFLHRYIVSVDNKFRKTDLFWKHGQSISTKTALSGYQNVNEHLTISLSNCQRTSHYPVIKMPTNISLSANQTVNEHFTTQIVRCPLTFCHLDCEILVDILDFWLWWYWSITSIVL